MIYQLGTKTINIPDAEIEKNSKILGITTNEAVQMWLEDNDYLTNETVETLTKKAKENGIKTVVQSGKPRKTAPRERKPDEEKENLIEILSNSLKNAGIDAKIVNKSKIIEFNVGNNHYKLDLIKQRPPKGE